MTEQTVGTAEPGAPSARGYALVVTGAILWGCLGLFYSVVMGRYGLSSLQTVFWRALIASLLLGLWLRVRAPETLCVQRQDLPLLLVMGAIGVAATFWIYAYAIREIGMGVAAVLQYVAPAWVALYSALRWGERVTVTRIVALVLALAGVALVGRIYDTSGVQLSLMGVLAALFTSITYASYVLMIKTATRRGYGARTILFYGLAVGTLCLAPLQRAETLQAVLRAPGIIPWLIALALVTLGAGLTFNAGLRDVPASSASIVATMEPLTAVVLGWLILSESMDGLQVLGALCILWSVTVLQLQRVKRHGKHGAP
ncbi:MAG: DMT family transporter [Anaerolineae bacterium]